ncbi:unnamed protein product [Prunus armeniaca]
MCFLVSVDTRNIFTSHLHAALLRKKIVTYIDYKLERGDEIGPALLEAIEKSKLSGIDPSDVRKQQGSYADAFAQLEERFKDSIDKVLNWNDALTKAASQFKRNLGLVGIERKIEQIESLLCIDSRDLCYVGIWGMPGIGKTTLAGAVFNRLSTKFEACFFLANVREESESHGLNQLRNKHLRMLLEEENLNIETPSVGSNFVGERLARTKVLIVLDDVNNLNQLELLAGDQDQFGPRSRITITARDRRLLKERVDDENIHKIKRLCFDEALQLLHLNAFKGNSPATNYAELSKVVLDYADGNPLALKILGSSFLHCKSKEDWEDELNKLKKFPRKEIQNVLRLSYDGLEENEKEIFLDIACFYKGMDVDLYAKRMSDVHGCFQTGIRVLIDMSLISISERNCLEMHNLLQEMGQAIVREQCIENPGKCSRLWIAEDVKHVLENKMGRKYELAVRRHDEQVTEQQKVQVIFFNISEIKELHLSRKAFKKMHHLRLLKIYNSSNDNYCKLYLSQGLQYLPNTFRYLHWEGYPLKTLPSKIFPENLLELRMPHSQVEHLTVLYETQISSGHAMQYGNFNVSLDCIEELPSSVWSSEKLDVHHIGHCLHLKNLPSNSCKLKCSSDFTLQGCSSLVNFTELPSNMTRLDLSGSAIEVLPSSIERLFSLTSIELKNCKRLVTLPVTICKLKCLGSLRLTDCTALEYFPEILEPMKELHSLSLARTAVKKLPSSIRNLSRLMTLELPGCKNLDFVPTASTI